MNIFVAAIPFCLGALLIPELAKADFVLVQNGDPKTAIYVAPSVMASDVKLEATATYAQTDAENKRRRLRESVNDLALYLQKMSGAKIGIFQSAPNARDITLPILIGNLAAARFGSTPKAPAQQDFRVVAGKNGVGLWGETDEATSYAIYEVLDRSGCRWYLSSEMGEVIPQRKTIALPLMDFAGKPGTLVREVWFVDDDFKRRNRNGGPRVYAEHALEYYITDEQRKQHPEWRAVFNGEPNLVRLKWNNSEVQQAVADAIIKKLDAHYKPSISL